MPILNLYTTNTKYEDALKAKGRDLRVYLAKELSCGDIELTPEEISIRFIASNSADTMIGKVEAEIFVYHFEDRVKNQDIICRKVARFLEEILKLDLQEVQCWLILSELGHSWEQ